MNYFENVDNVTQKRHISNLGIIQDLFRIKRITLQVNLALI